MKVTTQHHNIAKAAFQDGKNTPQVQAILHKEGLTKSQANSACRTARKALDIYKPLTKEQRAKSDADRQAEMKTEIDLDA
jgi:hypothetical protein